MSHDLSVLPLFERLRDAKRVLIAGAGGGFDVYAGVPLYLHLRARGVEVHLANLTFSYVAASDAQCVFPSVYRVDAKCSTTMRYFPEGWLCRWLAERGDTDAAVYTFEKTGVAQLRDAYAWLVETLKLDAVVLVDGGTDILMRGDEEDLGTPEEDMTSLAAAASLDLPTRAVLCVGFGIDAYHGVCHAHFLENVAALDAEGAFWGAFTLLRSTPEVAGYIDLVRSVHAAHPEEVSIVNGSIVASMEGRFGDYHFTPRTGSSELFINPLMALCWAFDLGALARRSMLVPEIANTRSIFDTASVIRATRIGRKLRAFQGIPV